jgi:hypothetical protein
LPALYKFSASLTNDSGLRVAVGVGSNIAGSVGTTILLKYHAAAINTSKVITHSGFDGLRLRRVKDILLPLRYMQSSYHKSENQKTGVMITYEQAFCTPPVPLVE